MCIVERTRKTAFDGHTQRVPIARYFARDEQHIVRWVRCRARHETRTVARRDACGKHRRDTGFIELLADQIAVRTYPSNELDTRRTVRHADYSHAIAERIAVQAAAGRDDDLHDVARCEFVRFAHGSVIENAFEVMPRDRKRTPFVIAERHAHYGFGGEQA